MVRRPTRLNNLGNCMREQGYVHTLMNIQVREHPGVRYSDVKTTIGASCSIFMEGDVMQIVASL